MTGFSFLRSFFDFCKLFTTSFQNNLTMEWVLMDVICKPFTTRSSCATSGQWC